jgi:CheY-like chemotaxis protein
MRLVEPIAEVPFVVKFETAREVPFQAEGEPARLKAELAAARESARLKSELVATVSHELRTPLTAVLGFAELLLHRDLDEDTRERYAQAIHDEAKRLAALIDDFLDLEKISAGRFTLALGSFEMSALIEHEVMLFALQSANHSLEFIAPDSPLVMVGDRNRVGQVIANLLSNAIKYSPAGGTVTVTGTRRAGFARVQVSDSGLGIPSDQQARVFTRFFRVDSTDTREIGGTGLGLSLCQEIVAAHGGRMGFESKEGAGSAFWFELPTTLRDKATAGAARVLVIDDDPARGPMLVECLALDGLDVELAATGQLGLERALALPPAVICLALSSPGELDGWQVMVRLKSNPATTHIPVIVCAGASGRATAATLGANDFLVTPLTPGRLRKAVAGQLSAARPAVLVVGNDHALRRLVVETLARGGGDLREAADDLAALAMLAARQPDVLVLDLPDPGPDSFGAIQQLLERPETRGLAVILLAGRQLSANERRFLKKRAVSLIQKSEYSGDQLRRLIHHAPSTLAHAAASQLADPREISK